MELGKEYFGPLWKYIANEEITDVDYNGREIWLTNIYNERYRVNQAYVEYDFGICRTVYPADCKCGQSAV